MRFLSSVCIAAIATALFRMLVPENKFSKQISLLITAVFLLTGISAAFGTKFDFDEDYNLEESEDYISFSDEVNENLKQKVCDEMSEKVRAILAAEEIYPEEIHIIVNISGLYSIDITQVKLVFSAGEQAAAKAAAEVLSRELSESIKITTEVKE